ncbi:VPA1262 family N-terminal domain-containing protein [Azotobacter chroococcum]|uniref:Uncharacterized protein n=1 Tax=Azotobacter chroococcum NCIMB 8003 TaxID=1328314 RepID=A0A0C4WP68_9GAMM|nr:VPA1262 family N-terminal domain-containing protein [Azotobacter chroococcum]AJE19912.1 Hypothetical protein Achr_4060 [Azotobacter chroococcum NCIMB 8003]
MTRASPNKLTAARSTGQGWDLDRARGLITDLLRPTLLGIYNRFAVYEVFGIPKGGAPLNVLTVAVSEDSADTEEDEKPRVLTPNRIRIDGFPNWTFGVARTYRPIKSFDDALAAFERGQGWMPSGKLLEVGFLEVVSPMFVPPDGTIEVPINRLLKNNFWNGSHVIRLCDPSKASLLPFLDDRRRLQSLSEAISEYTPMSLAGMVDYLGDVLIQIPVTGMAAKVTAPKSGGPINVTVEWHPSVPPRTLIATARMYSDAALTGAGVSGTFTHSTTLTVDSHVDPVEAAIWDEETGVLLAATAPTSTVSQIVVHPRLGENEPRVFTTRKADGTSAAARVSLTHVLEPIIVGSSRSSSADQWRRRRTDLDESRRLAEARDFVQYRPKAGDNSERERALADINFLINKHGEGGIDLWDPYLSADDLLQTLFWSATIGAPLRAITDGKEPPKCGCEARKRPDGQVTPPESFADRQRKTLARDSGNLYGLRLEYRARTGPKGWSFHDRFLIFPNLPEGPAAWSLGTSVNSLGKAHHILQRVSNAALIAGAFEDLWAELDEPIHLVWRSW